MLALNLRFGYVLSRAAIPAMLNKNMERFVNVGVQKLRWITAPVSPPTPPTRPLHWPLMDSLAAEVKGTGVRVNSILPALSTQRRIASHAWAPTLRVAEAQEIASVILFLCSDDAKVIHGEAVPVYGIAET